MSYLKKTLRSIITAVLLILLTIILYSCGGKVPETAWIARNAQNETLPLVLQEDPNYCVAATICSHLEYWHESNPYTQAQIFWLADVDNNQQVSFVEAHNYFDNWTNRYYWAIEYNTAQYQEWIATCTLVDPGTPPIISVGQAGGYHFVSVVAVIWTDDPNTPTAFIVEDPSGRGEYGSQIGIPGSFWRVEAPAFLEWISAFVVGDSVLHLGMADESSRGFWPASYLPEPDWGDNNREVVANALYRTYPPGMGDRIEDELPYDDGGGCNGCPLPEIDTTEQHIYNLAMAYIAQNDTMLLSFIYEYCSGATGWYFGEIRDVLFPGGGSSKTAVQGADNLPPDDPVVTGQPGYLVVPIITGGYEVGSVLIFDGPDHHYGGCAFYPYLELLAKRVNNEASKISLIEYGLKAALLWKVDPEQLISRMPAKNIVSASLPGLEGCDVEYFFEWGPEPNVPFFHYARVTYPDASVKIFDIFNVEYVCGDDGYLHRKDRNQYEDSGSARAGGSSVPRDFVLKQNYPNPFNAATTIEYSLAAAGPVKLEVYDVLGQQVQILIDGYKSAGQHRVEFDCGSLASGMYFYRLTTDGGTETRKMMLMK